MARVGAFATVVAAAAAQAVYLVPPPTGSIGPITGQITGIDPATHKGIVLVTADQQQFWDKTHSQGIPFAADGTFSLADWAWDPQGDAQVQYFAFYVVPMDFVWQFTDGQPIPASLQTAAVAEALVNRDYPMTPPGGGPGQQPTRTASPAATRPANNNSQQPSASRSPNLRTSGAETTAASAAVAIMTLGAGLMMARIM